MTKKDFIAIAALLDANHASLAICQDFADLLAEENERFDRRRFLDAACINIALDAQSELRRILKETTE